MSNKVAEVQQMREQMVKAAKAIVKAGAISRSGHGNMSVRIPGTNTMLLTAVSNLEELDAEALPLVTFDGKVVDGKLEAASAEIVGMHGVVYDKNPALGAAVHTHAPNVTSYAVASRPIECWYEGLARFGVTDPVPVAKYGPRGSKESIGNIADVIGERSRGVLLENHGVLTFERDIMGAVRILILMEEAAELGIRASLLGKPALIPPEMLGYTQQRAKEFAAAGTVHAGGHVHKPSD